MISRNYVFADGVQLDIGERTLIMGILNATPDSFSDGGRYDSVERAVAHALAMVDAGADIIDVGGESTRPGSTPVSAEAEIARVVPVIRALREALPHVSLSIDTYKASTAQAALEAGAHIINDVMMLRHDADARMAQLAAQYRCPIIISHNRDNLNYTNVTEDVVTELMTAANGAMAQGVDATQIWLDPGIGFAKTMEHNYVLMNELEQLTALPYPILLGTSRKRFIRETLALPVDQLTYGTAATVAIGIAKGCQLVRVHDVAEMKQVAVIADRIRQAGGVREHGSN